MRQVHLAGEKLFIDYAGQTVTIVDPDTGEMRAAHIFVAVLGASNYTYACATAGETQGDWLRGLTQAPWTLEDLQLTLQEGTLWQAAPTALALPDAEMAATRAYAWCWIAIATLLFLALVVIAWDMLIVRRYWARSLSRLHDDRRAMIARQLSRHRAEKNGYHSEE